MLCSKFKNSLTFQTHLFKSISTQYIQLIRTSCSSDSSVLYQVALMNYVPDGPLDSVADIVVDIFVCREKGRK